MAEIDQIFFFFLSFLSPFSLFAAPSCLEHPAHLKNLTPQAPPSPSGFLIKRETFQAPNQIILLKVISTDHHPVKK